MATMILKSTYSLDKETTEAIRGLSLEWKVSQAEVVRASIQMAVKQSKANKTCSPLDILESLEKKKKVSATEIANYKKIVEENRTGWDFLEGRILPIDFPIAELAADIFNKAGRKKNSKGSSIIAN